MITGVSLTGAGVSLTGAGVSLTGAGVSLTGAGVCCSDDFSVDLGRQPSLGIQSQ